MLSLSQPKTPLKGDGVRSPDGRPQPLDFYRQPEHIECSALLSARHQRAVNQVGTNECGYHRMQSPGHRKRILPRTIKECRIQHQYGTPGGKQQEVGHLYGTGAMQADASLAEHRSEKQCFMVETGEENAVHSTASR